MDPNTNRQALDIMADIIGPEGMDLARVMASMVMSGCMSAAQGDRQTAATLAAATAAVLAEMSTQAADDTIASVTVIKTGTDDDAA